MTVRICVLVAAAVALSVLLFGRADGADASVVAQLINDTRAAQGLTTLPTASDLNRVAQRHARELADAGDLYHNPDIGSEVHGWATLAENVGRGPSASSIHDAFMGSAGHRANILDPRWDDLGVGAVHDDGRLWVVQVFRETQPAQTLAPQSAPQPSPPPDPPPPPPPPPSPPAPVPSPEPSPTEVCDD